MPSAPFRFKQFTIVQNTGAMKVTTDGVLLGVWQYKNNAVQILDIGTGTGLIALMMAQGNTKAQIDAIDIDAEACMQAKQNFDNSQWGERLNVFHTSLQRFLPDKKYGLIVSNPPYFINDQKSHRHEKNVARHTIELSYEDLMAGIKRLMTDDGKALLIVPIANFQLLQSVAAESNLFVAECLYVSAIEGKQPYVVLAEMHKSSRPMKEEYIVIQDREGNFTKEYMELTSAFYLNF